MIECLVRFGYCVVDRGCDVWSGLGIVSWTEVPGRYLVGFAAVLTSKSRLKRVKDLTVFSNKYLNECAHAFLEAMANQRPYWSVISWISFTFTIWKRNHFGFSKLRW